MSTTQSKSYSAAVLTISDSRSTGKNVDTVGPQLIQILTDAGFSLIESTIIPDEKNQIADALINLVDNKKPDLIITTGGTGISPRDTTPEATREVIKYEIPGLAECIRFEGSQNTKLAWLSRGVTGVRAQTIIINVPGSERGAIQSLSAVIGILKHAISTVKGESHECGKKLGEKDSLASEETLKA